ncbi:type IV secretion system protein [Variovorax sp. J22R24]|uniref:type IV secretion system protein n=1 Tax=Variovorax gracilis TaxID=3053502 RepID=UPI002576CC2E|nr:type IV secretion system protein [Variovorax sp. J22R24]MDM0108453.1 type IV secretion system protein [Variovorax sp. J22R24]
MADNIIGDIYNNFERALAGFYQSAAMGVSSYVIPIAWVLLGICMLIWCYLIIEGKVTMPITDWLLKFVGFMVVLYVMGNGYLSWVATPLFALPSELTRALSATSGSAPDLLGQVNEKVVDLVSAMFTAGTKLIKELAFGPAIALFLMGVLVIVAVYLMLAAALFSVIFSELGLSMVLAVGPFFVLALVLPQTRNYFYSWLNTALYFVFYHVFTALFIFMFIGIVNSYVGKLNSTLGGVGGGNVLSMVARLLGASGEGLNVAAITIPILIISLAMFFMFLQIPTICASLTGGSGGSFGAGLTNLTHAKSLLTRSRVR